MTLADVIAAFVDREFPCETEFLAELVKVPSDNGPTDLVARIVADGLTRRLGQRIVIESKPGASGTTAAALVARAAPDGYTLFAIPSGHAFAAATYKTLPYRIRPAIAPRTRNARINFWSGSVLRSKRMRCRARRLRPSA